LILPITGLRKKEESRDYGYHRKRQTKCERKTYVRRNGNAAPEKIFVDVTSCCLQECYTKIDHESQLRLFSSFYVSNKSKQEQDLYVASMITQAPQKRPLDLRRDPKRPNRWTYEVSIDGSRIPVCQTFLLKVFQLSQKRIRVIQKRLTKNECTFEERRGKHNNRPHKLPDDTMELFHAHLREIPPEGRPSPSDKKFSKNLHFTKKKLFELFRDYYCEKTGKVLPMKYNTYVQICNRLTQ